MFKDYNKDDLINFFKDARYNVVNYNKNDIVALEGDSCLKVGVILDGNIDIKRTLTSNSVIHVASFSKGNLFGEVIAFSDINKYPATVISSSNSSVLFINKEDFINYCTNHPNFLTMFLNDLTNKIVTLNNSIGGLSLSSIKQKICHYLLNEYKTQNTNFIKLDVTKQKLAEKLGIPRPSLSRELINMQNEGFIENSKDYIKILDIESIQDILME